MHYWQLHIGDWSKSCGHLTPSETGFYVRLLNVYYDTESPIPADLSAACRLAGARTPREREEISCLLSEFFTLSDDGWHNKRADSEINRLHAIGEKRSSAAAKRWHSTSNANAVQMHSTSNALQDSKTPRLQEPIQDQKREQSATPPVADAPSPASGKARKPKAVGQRKPLLTLDEWLADCKAKDEKTMPATDPIFEWAADAGIPIDYLRLAWLVFLRDWKAKKPQQDWRATYRNAVRQNWLKLWFFHADGDCRLTTTGEQERRAHE